MRSWTLRLALIGMLLAFTWFPSAIPQAAAQTAERCFTETGHCIAGRIREFWERNGGLPVFGFPIGPQREEQIEGKPFQVQWFERNRLELHPENARPYDVLIGRLGADRLTQQGRDWFSFPKSEPRAECRFFAETGHNLCGAILSAWRAQGLDLDGCHPVSEAESLGLFGLPLSDEQTETIEGKEYTVQWFERARFELHPENQPPYNVLLGRLGAEVRGMQPAAPAPLPPPSSGTREVVTSVGTLMITATEISETFPPGCTIGCSRAKDGYKIVIVWLARKDGGSANEIGSKLFDASEGAKIVANDGSETQRFSGGMVSGKLFIGFTPPSSAHAFKLIWPENPPVDLGL